MPNPVTPIETRVTLAAAAGGDRKSTAAKSLPANLPKAIEPIDTRVTLAARAKANMFIAGRDGAKSKWGSTNLSNPIEPIDTRQELATASNVSQGTLAAIQRVETAAPEPIKLKARRGELSIHRRFSRFGKFAETGKAYRCTRNTSGSGGSVAGNGYHRRAILRLSQERC